MTKKPAYAHIKNPPRNAENEALRLVEQERANKFVRDWEAGKKLRGS